MYFTVCPSGSYYNADNANTCQLCPIDTFGSGTNANRCTDCPSGTITQTLIGQTMQDACSKPLLPKCLRKFNFMSQFLICNN